MDAVQKAESGHPGTPMALAPLAYKLYMQHLKHDPSDPRWFDRDRFVLSAGHASMLLYSALYLSGYDVSLEDLKQFRQWGSKTPGHPEYGYTDGVETTTGPLGQGLANAVGMAMAEAHLAAVFNKPGHEIVDHHTWFIASDGDLMEGVSHEAASFAGHNGLGKLIGFYDDNHITIDGPTDARLQRRRRHALRGLRLARAPSPRRERSRRDRSRDRRGQGRDAPTHARHYPDAHRLRQPEEAGHRVGTWRAARKGRGRRDEEEPRLALARRDVQGAARGAGSLPKAQAGMEKAEGGVDEAPGRAPRRARAEAPHRGQAARRLGIEDPRVQQGERQRRQPRRVQRGAERARRSDAGTGRRIGRPHAVERHRAQGPGQLRARPEGRPLRALRHSRARHGVHHERPLAARRYPSVRRNVPDLQRLHAAGGPARRHHAAAGALRVHARFGRPRRGRARRTSPSSSSPRCAPSRNSRSSVRRTPARRPRRGVSRSRTRTARRRWSSRGRNSATSTATSTRRRRGWCWARTSSPTATRHR